MYVSSDMCSLEKRAESGHHQAAERSYEEISSLLLRVVDWHFEPCGAWAVNGFAVCEIYWVADSLICLVAAIACWLHYRANVLMKRSTCHIDRRTGLV